MAAVFLLLSVAGGTACAAQAVNVPRLLRRSATSPDAPEATGNYRPGRWDLPDEAAGTYALSEDPVDVIEIIVNGDDNQARLEGYLTRLGDGVSDRGAPLTYFFDQTSVSPEQLQFATRQVHGAWWSFTGRIDRGSAQQSTQKGYYFLNGTLVEHFASGQSQARRVSLPLLPQGTRQSQ